MNYPHFYEKITVSYGIDIIGWPCQFINPSLLSEGDLTKLQDAWLDKTCHFKKLTHEEKKLRVAVFETDVAAGTVKQATCKPRKDNGGTHAKSCKVIEDDIVDSDSNSDSTTGDNDNGNNDEGPNLEKNGDGDCNQEGHEDPDSLENSTAEDGDQELGNSNPTALVHPSTPPSTSDCTPLSSITNVPVASRLKRTRNAPARVPQLAASKLKHAGAGPDGEMPQKKCRKTACKN
jgi:hypothetical protein